MHTLRRVVLVVALVNLAYFFVEFTVALIIGSVSLFADSVDFLEDALIKSPEGFGVGCLGPSQAHGRIGGRSATAGSG